MQQLSVSPDPMHAPEITVVVVNYNGGRYLAACLSSLARQTFQDFELIVVDNASTDGSIDHLGELPRHTTILREHENHGFAAGNNLGAALGRGRWLALLNPDAEANPEWLDNLLKSVRKRPSHRIVASLQIAMHDRELLDGAGDCYLAFGYAWRGGFGHSVKDAPLAGECFAPCGAAAFYPRDVFLESGGFDERYFCYHEDVDLGFRLRLLGERCQFSPLCVVTHAGSGIVGRGSSFAVFHGARNGLWTYVKNMPGPLLLATLPFWTVGTLAILGRGVITGRFAATFRGLIAGLAGLGPALAARARFRKRRRANLRSIVKALCWNPFLFLARKPRVMPFAAHSTP